MGSMWCFYTQLKINSFLHHSTAEINHHGCSKRPTGNSDLVYLYILFLFRSFMGTLTAPPQCRTCCAPPSWPVTSAFCRWAGTPASLWGWSCWCAWTSVPDVHSACLLLTVNPHPANPLLAKGWKDPPCNSVMTFMSLTRLSLHKVRAGGHIWYTVYLSESLYVLILSTCKNRIGHLPQCLQGIPV